jgi:hypothetical protein
MSGCHEYVSVCGDDKPEDTLSAFILSLCGLGTCVAADAAVVAVKKRRMSCSDSGDISTYCMTCVGLYVCPCCMLAYIEDKNIKNSGKHTEESSDWCELCCLACVCPYCFIANTAANAYDNIDSKKTVQPIDASVSQPLTTQSMTECDCENY